MKTHTLKIIIVLFIIVFSAVSCSVDDYKVQGRSTKESLIQNESSARSALAGIYEAIRPNSSIGLMRTMMSLTMAGTEQQPAGSVQGGVSEDLTSKSFYNNDVKPVPANRRSGGLLTFYRQSYIAINLANFFIKTIEENGINGTSKETQNEIIAEAKALRAHSYFQLLRVFGQFYKPESEYGVITTTDVITNSTFLKRGKVNDTYNLIISDLEFAIQNVSNNNHRYFVTKEYAKGLLAKVYLYKGGTENWTKTVRYCKDIIDNLGGKFGFAPDYITIFKEKLESAEVIFSPYYNIKGDQTIGTRGQFPISSDNIKPSNYFKDFASSMVKDTIAIKEIEDEYGPTGVFQEQNIVRYDPRYRFTFGKSILDNKTDAYNKYYSSSSPFYYLRVTEVYLMYAEALVRTGGDVQIAVDILNKIRKRAYENIYPSFNFYKGIKAPLITFSDKVTLLEDIRKEKMLEFHLENAQSWFDLVRYAQLGDINPSEIKTTLKNENQFIFPIPLRVIRNNPNFGPQNPGY